MTITILIVILLAFAIQIVLGLAIRSENMTIAQLTDRVRACEHECDRQRLVYNVRAADTEELTNLPANL